MISEEICDYDGDGLLDRWGKNGIDVNYDRIIDLDLKLLGAKYDHKDLFVEVDYMKGHKPHDGDFENIKEAFAKSPLENHDEKPGIKLHVDVSEEIEEELVINSKRFHQLAKEWFGDNKKHRQNLEELQAKKLSYRHMLFIHQNEKGSIGRGETPGDEFFVSLGDWRYGIRDGHNTGNQRSIERTFMHEMGHTLNLKHVGSHSNDYNCKPNYISVMNYAFTLPKTDPDAPLDFSRIKLDTLYETKLVEKDVVNCLLSSGYNSSSKNHIQLF